MSRGHLIDTNTVSELVSVKPDQPVLDWIDTADESRLFLSVMTLGEIRQGVATLPQSKSAPPWKLGWRLTCKPVLPVAFCPLMGRLLIVGVGSWHNIEQEG